MEFHRSVELHPAASSAVERAATGDPGSVAPQLLESGQRTTCDLFCTGSELLRDVSDD